jgi:hypothetical protein
VVIILEANDIFLNKIHNQTLSQMVKTVKLLQLNLPLSLLPQMVKAVKLLQLNLLPLLLLQLASHFPPLLPLLFRLMSFLHLPLPLLQLPFVIIQLVLPLPLLLPVVLWHVFYLQLTLLTNMKII